MPSERALRGSHPNDVPNITAALRNCKWVAEDLSHNASALKLGCILEEQHLRGTEAGNHAQAVD